MATGISAGEGASVEAAGAPGSVRAEGGVHLGQGASTVGKGVPHRTQETPAPEVFGLLTAGPLVEADEERGAAGEAVATASPPALEGAADDEEVAAADLDASFAAFFRRKNSVAARPAAATACASAHIGPRRDPVEIWVPRPEGSRRATGPSYRAALLPPAVTGASAEGTVRARGLVLPAPPTPKGAYVPVVVHGGLAWVSGMLPFQDGRLVAQGLVGGGVEVATAKQAARWAALNALSALREALGSLDRVERVIRVGVFVASAPTFQAQPEVANGASEVLQEVFGESGRHARAAVGVASLPLGASVEVEVLVALRAA